MRTQTRFLAEAFRDYERRVRDSGACDEHTLRERLMAEPAIDPVRHVIVTVPDWIADADGLYSADFDLLTRIPGLEALDIVSTERVLSSGFHERLHNWWPGLEETGCRRHRCSTPIAHHARRVRRRTNPGGPCAIARKSWSCVARRLNADRRNGDAVPLDRTAVVFKHPLPYLYLAAEVFGAAGIPYQASDALPLAAEPTAAAIDLVLDAVASNFTRAHARRAAAVAAFRLSPGRGRGDARGGRRPRPRAEPGAVPRRRRTAGDAGVGVNRTASAPALHAALAAARELAPLAAPHPASEQMARLLAFWTARSRPIADDDPFAARERRARAAVDRDADRARRGARGARRSSPGRSTRSASRCGDGLASRRSSSTTTTRRQTAVQLLDDQAARYGDFDDVAIVGVVEPDWPERPRRNIFYPPALLKSLGWPSEKDRRAAADARFLDLLASASRRTLVSTFTLDDDALVTRSMQLDEIPRARLSSAASAPFDDARVFIDEALSLEPLVLDPFAGETRAWAELRSGRSPADAPDFHGTVRDAPVRAWSVSALETYLDCPFKFFAQHVLRLEEEPDDEEVMDPRRQGQFVHEVFETFFTAWQGAGHRAITPQNLDDARARCSRQSSTARSSACPRPRPDSNARACSDRRRRPGSARRSSGWKPSVPSPSSNACSSTGWTASSRSPPPMVRGRSRCAARPIASICSRTARSG